MIGFVSILSTLVILVILTYVVFKKCLRPKFPARVSCWFCGFRTSVPYEKADSFVCPECDQYNGFNKDGDYNKPILGQYDELENAATSPCRREEFLGGVDVLCDRCSQNQLLKVKQLANFAPYNEKNYDWEVTAFERHLERVYRICGECEAKVQRELEIQNEALARRLHNSDYLGSDRSFHQLEDDEEEEMIQDTMCVADDQSRSHATLSLLLHVSSLICAGGLLLCQLDSCQLPVPVLVHWSVVLHLLLAWLDRHGEALAWLGLVTAMTAKLLVGKHRLSLLDVLSGPVWLVVVLVQTGFLGDVGSSISLAAGTANILACLLCLMVRRNPQGRSNVNISRSQALRSSDRGTASLPPTLLDDLHAGEDTDLDEDEVATLDVDGQTRQPAVSSSSSDVGSLTDQLSVLDSWIRRRTGHSQNEPDSTQQMHPSRTTDQSDIRMTSLSPSTSQSNSRMSMSRPLISPASFKYTSTPDKHKFGWGPQNFGLFSVTREPVQPLFNGHEISASLGPSPEKLAVSTVQSFGTSPYCKVSHKTITADSFARHRVRSTESTICNSPLEPMALETERDRGSRLLGNNTLPDSYTTLKQSWSTLDTSQTYDRYQTRSYERHSRQDQRPSRLDTGRTNDQDGTRPDPGQTILDADSTTNDDGQTRLEEGQIMSEQGGTKPDGSQAMECVEESVDNLVDQLFDLPTFSQNKASTGLRRTDSGFFSYESDCDTTSALGEMPMEQTGSQASPGPKPLVKSARFEYQSALHSQDTVDYSKLSTPGLVPSRGWKTLQESEMHLLPTRDYMTGFGTAPYNNILKHCETE